MTALKMYVLM